MRRHQDALSPDRGGSVFTLLPISDEIEARRKDVHVEFTLVHTLLGYAFVASRILKFDVIPGDKEFALEWVTTYMPKLLEGWKEGKGSSMYRAQRIRKLEGGLDR